MTKHPKVIFMAMAIVGFLGLAVFSAFAEAPSGNPPHCPESNPACNPPVNVGPASQIKNGALGILGNFSVGFGSSPKTATVIDTLEVKRGIDSTDVISVKPPKASTVTNASISTSGNLDLVSNNSTAFSNVYIKNSIGGDKGANLVVTKGVVQSIQTASEGSLILGNNNAKVWSPWVSSLHFSVFPDVKGGTGQMAFSFEGNGSTEGRKFMMQKDFFRPMEDNYATLGIPFARWKNVYSVGADVGNITIRGGNPALNKILASDAVGLASWKTAAELGLDSGSGVSNWTLTGTNLTNNNTTGNVGIGITPTARLHVNGSVKVGQKNPLEMGAGLSKESSAGKIAYQLFSSGLDIVGAGTVNGSRLVKLWDNVEVPSTITTNNLKAVNLCTTAGACATVQNIINGLSNSLTPGGLGYDIDANGRVDQADQTIVINCNLGASSCTSLYRLRSDLNRDGRVDTADVQMITNAALFHKAHWLASGDNIYSSNTGNVGIGISTPVSKLTVNGNIRGATLQSITGSDTGVLTFGSNVNAKVLAPWIDALHFSVSPGKEIGTGSMAFTFGGDGVMTGRKYFLNATAFRPSASGGATLGISDARWGTLYSTSADVSGQVTIRGGNPGANKILTSDATGLASWKSGRLEERYPNFGGYEASGTDCPTILTGINICNTYTTATRGSDYYNISNDRPALGWGGGQLSSPSCGPGFVATGGSADYVGVSFTGAGMSSWPGDYNNWECKMNLTSAVQAGTFKCWARCTKI